MKTTAVIPGKNEVNTILSVVRGALRFADEVIVVVSKNSTDGTLNAVNGCDAKTIIDSGIGKGDAIKLGAEAAYGDIIVFLDADGSHITDDIPKLTGPIKSGKADLVIGSRNLGGSEEFTGDLYKRMRVFLSNLITLIINLRFGSAITDSQNGFRAIRKDVMANLDLKADGFDIETEMLMKALKMGYKVAEVPSKELMRKHGSSGIRISTMGWRYVWRVLINLL